MSTKAPPPTEKPPANPDPTDARRQPADDGATGGAPRAPGHLGRFVNGRFDRLRVFLDRALAPGQRDHSLAVALCFVLITLGIYWRFVDIAFPPYFTFDEHHFVRNARNYIQRVADWNDHPPMGKLLMVPGILLFGDNGFGWRIHEAILGALHVYVMFRIARALFQDRRTALLAAAFVAVDGIFIAYSRTALLDIPMDFFMMLSLLWMLEGKSLWWFLAATVALAMGVLVKWIAVLLILAAPFLLRRRGKSIFHALWMGPLVLAIYGFVWWLSLVITRQPASPAIVLQKNLALFRSHTGFTDWKNAADSRWYTWPFLYKPIVLHYAQAPNGYVRMMSSIGNPLVWYATTATWVLTLVELGRAGLAWIKRRTPFADVARAQALTLFVAFALIVQWLTTNRESYIWHYMGTYGMGLLLLAERGGRVWRRDPLKVAVALVLVGAVALFYSSVWTNDCISRASMMARLPFPGWR